MKVIDAGTTAGKGARVPEDAHVDEHLRAEELGAFIDRRQSAIERARAASHLDACPACRHELLAVRALLDMPAAPARRIHPRTVWGGAVAAAALLVLVALPASRNRAEVEAVRTGANLDGEGVSGIEVVEPRADGSVGENPIRFTWRSRVGEPTYALVLTDSRGSRVWETVTRDTSVVIDSAITLTRGMTYFWVVDALDRSGRVASTGAQRLELLR